MKKQNLKLALIVAAVGVAAQSQAALESITYTESPDSGNFPPGGVFASANIDVAGGVAVSGTLDVFNAVPVAGGGNLSGVYTLVPGQNLGGDPSSSFSYDSLVDIANPGGQFLNNVNVGGGLLFADAAGDQMNMWYNAAAGNYSFVTPPDVVQPVGSYSLWGWQAGAGAGPNNDYMQTYGTAYVVAVPEPAATGQYAGFSAVGLLGLVTLRRKFFRAA